MVKVIYPLIACILILNGNMYAQDSRESEESIPINTDAIVEIQESDESNNVENTAFTVDQMNIINSIQVSNDYDLLLWVEGLGINQGNDRASLQKALLQYYGLPSNALSGIDNTSKSDPESATNQSSNASTSNTLGEGTTNEIVIKKANNARYFSYEKISEDVFILQGNVQIQINQQTEKRQHVIIADKLIYNENTRTGTAVGSVIYRVYEYNTIPFDDPSTQNAIEEFDSQVISFNIDDFNTDVLLGSTNTTKEMKYGRDNKLKDTLLFRIYSPYISTSKDNIITISNASFTSSEAIPPIYRIRLQKMWLLNPEEWAISKASIFVGEIPVLWLPFFVNPGDKFFFHPSIGYKIRTGGFINTTTYIIGTHTPSEEESDEFLGLFNFSRQKANKKIIKGLYLREKEPEDTVTEYPKDWLLRYLLDYYTGLGGYTAIEGKFPNLWLLNTLDFTVGLAMTQTVYNRDNIYFNYYIKDGKFTSNYDQGYFYNQKVPFRYKIILNTGLRFNTYYKTSLAFEMYSDSFLDRDFSQRSFDFSWDEFLDPNKRLIELNQRASQKSSYFWQWNNNITLPTYKWVGSYIRSMSISNLKFQANWARKNVASQDIIEAYTSGPGSVEEQIESYFFYPSQIEFPSYQMKVRGTLFTFNISDLDSSNKKSSDTEEAESSSPDYEIESPIRSSPKEEVSEEYEDEILTYPTFPIPKVQSQIFQWYKMTGDLSYTISHALNEIIYFNSAKWIKVEDVDYFDPSYIDYGYLTTNNRFDVLANLTFLDSWIKYQYKISLDLKYQFLNNDTNLTERNREERTQSTENYVVENLSNSNTITLYPLKWLLPMASSNISYVADFNLGKHIFNTVKEATWYEEDNDEWWNQHKINQVYNMTYWGAVQNARIAINLPPLTLEYSYSYDFSIKNLFLSISTKLIEDKDTKIISYDPLNFTGTLRFFDNNLSFTSKVSYEYEFEYIQSLSSTLKVWWLSSTLNAEYSQDYEFDSATLSFVSPNIHDKELRFKNWISTFNYTSPTLYLWQDRISYSFNSKVNFNYDFIQFINTSLSFSYGIKFAVYKFLTFSLSTSVTNEVIYTYFDEFASQLGIEKRDLWEDIVNGLSFGDEKKLRQSAFKMGTINASIVQDFGGWVFGVVYAGRPERVTENNVTNYQWKNSLELSVHWKPLPEFKSEAFYRDELWSLEEEITQ